MPQALMAGMIYLFQIKPLVITC